MPSQADQVFNIAWKFHGNVAPQLDRIATSTTRAQHMMENAGRSFQQTDRQLGKLHGAFDSSVKSLARITAATERYTKASHIAYDMTTKTVGMFGGQHMRRANELMHKYNTKTSLGYLAITRALNKQYRPAFGHLMKGYDVFNKTQTKLNGLLDKTDDAFAALNTRLTKGTSVVLGTVQDRWDKFVTSVTEAGDLGASFQFGDKLIDAQKQIKLTGQDLEDLRSVANELGVAVGKDRDIFVESLSPLIKYGIRGKEMLKAIGKAAGELEVTAGIPIDMTAEAFGKLSKKMDDLRPEDVLELTRSIASLGQAGGEATTQLLADFEDLGTYLMQIPKDAQKASIASFAAVSASLKREMIPPEEIAGLLKNVININEDAIRSSGNLAGMLTALTGKTVDFGHSWENMRKGRPDVIVTELAEAMAQLNVQQNPRQQMYLEKIVNTFGISKDTLLLLGKAYRSGAIDIDAMRQAFIDAGGDAQKFQALLDVQNSAVDRLREKVGAATGVLKAQFTDVLEKITRPALIGVSNALSSFVSWLEKGTEGMRTFKTLALVAFSGAIVSALVGLIGLTAALTLAVGGLNLAFRGLANFEFGKNFSKWVKESVTGIKGLEKTMTLATGGNAVIEKGALKAVWALIKEKKAFLGLVGPIGLANKAVKGLNMIGIGKDWKMATETVVQSTNRWTTATGFFAVAGRNLEKVFKGLGEAATYVGVGLWNLSKIIYGSLFTALKFLLSPVTALIKTIPILASSLSTLFLNPVGMAIALAAALVGVYVLLSKAPEKVQTAVGSFLDGFGDVLESIPTYFMKGADAVLTGVTTVLDVVSGLFTDFSGTIAKLTGYGGATAGGAFEKSFVKFFYKTVGAVGLLLTQFFVVLPLKLAKVAVLSGWKLGLSILYGIGKLIKMSFQATFGGIFMSEAKKSAFLGGHAVAEAFGKGAADASGKARRHFAKMADKSFWQAYVVQPIADYFTDLGIEIGAEWDKVIIGIKEKWFGARNAMYLMTDAAYKEKMAMYSEERKAVDSQLEQDLTALATERARLQAKADTVALQKEEISLGKDQLNDEQKRLKAAKAWKGRAMVDLKAMRALGITMRQNVAGGLPERRAGKNVAAGAQGLAPAAGTASLSRSQDILFANQRQDDLVQARLAEIAAERQADAASQVASMRGGGKVPPPAVSPAAGIPPAMTKVFSTMLATMSEQTVLFRDMLAEMAGARAATETSADLAKRGESSATGLRMYALRMMGQGQKADPRVQSGYAKMGKNP